MHFQTTGQHSFDAITRNGSSFQWDVQSGRPVYAVFRYYGKMLINDISSFSYLRLLIY